MFIVVKSSQAGADTPVLFANKYNATRFKRRLALSEAFLTMWGEEFTLSLNEGELEILKGTIEKLDSKFLYKEFTTAENELLEKFERFLVARKSCFTEFEDMIAHPVYEYTYVQVFEVPGLAEIQTSAGVTDALSYDDGIAKGVHIYLDGIIVCALDVYETEEKDAEGEARILVYKKEYGEDEEEAPIECITINR